MDKHNRIINWINEHTQGQGQALVAVSSKKELNSASLCRYRIDWCP